MTHDQIGNTTRRDFLGTATAATALTLALRRAPKRKLAQSNPTKLKLRN